MREVEVKSYPPGSSDFHVYLFPSTGGQPKELPVTGTVLLQITFLEGLTPVKEYKLSPAFVHGEDIIFGAEFWDPKRDGGELVIVPPATSNPKAYARARYKQQLSARAS